MTVYRLSNHPDLVGILPSLFENPDAICDRDSKNHYFEICFDKYTGAPNRVYSIETDTHKT